MTRAFVPIYSMSSGEISPLLHGRPDYQRFQTGLASCRGYLPLLQGGVTRAPGTLQRGYTKDNREARLIPFEFAANDALTLEFTDGIMRVWRYGALVESGGVPFELVIPYDLAAIKRLHYVQSADVIYLADGQRPIQRLARMGLADWSIEDENFNTGPFRTQNLDKSKTIQVNVGVFPSFGAAINLDGSGGPFKASQVGSLIRLQPTDYSQIALWTSNTTLNNGQLIRSDGKIYEFLSGANSGVNAPFHTEGRHRTDEQSNSIYEFVSDDYGIVAISSVTNSNNAVGKVIKAVPRACADDPTYRWSEGAWSDQYGYPATLEIYDQRLVAAATPTDPRTIWFSTLGVFSDFEPSIDPDGSFAYTIGGRNSINRILWLRSGARGLHIGALGEEFSTRSDTASQVIGPTTTKISFDGSIGSVATQPIAPDGNPIFISRDTARVFEIAYSFQDDRNQSRELSRPSDHLGEKQLVDITWQSAPRRIAWIRRADGSLIAMIYAPDEEVLGWAVYTVAGDGEVEAMSVSPDATGKNDILTLVVKRTIGGAVVRHIEEQSVTFGVQNETDILAANHLFASKVFAAGDMAVAGGKTTLSVDHLIGETVELWTDQGSYGPVVVEPDGTVEVDAELSSAIVGLFDDTHEFETLPLQAQARDGATLGRLRKLEIGTGLQLHRTAGGFAQVIEREFTRPPTEKRKSPLVADLIAIDNSVGYSGSVELQIESGHATEVALRFTPFSGAPMTVLAIVAPIDGVSA